ncbi:MAG TPA: NADH-quinone oxidoreductase subunit J, partial [Solirubrobacterales bacterium]|nr:NADH-quinone oxidoreductase subunit J [Solirubrobacterales bacterium]
DSLFAAFGVVAVVGALYAVLTRSLLRAIVALGAFLTAVAGEFYLLAADFVAVVQIFVYVGGILVLMLFALMLSASGVRHPLAAIDRPGLGAVLAYSMGGGLLWASWTADIPGAGAVPDDAVGALGRSLLGAQLGPFELIGVILLASVVAALSIARRERP